VQIVPTCGGSGRDAEHGAAPGQRLGRQLAEQLAAPARQLDAA
jgi:hypothetical protein